MIILRLTKKNQNIWFIIFIIQKVQSVTSKENRWSEWLKLTVPVKAQCHNYKGPSFLFLRVLFFTFLNQWEQEQALSSQFVKSLFALLKWHRWIFLNLMWELLLLFFFIMANFYITFAGSPLSKIK